MNTVCHSHPCTNGVDGQPTPHYCHTPSIWRMAAFGKRPLVSARRSAVLSSPPDLMGMPRDARYCVSCVWMSSAFFSERELMKLSEHHRPRSDLPTFLQTHAQVYRLYQFKPQICTGVNAGAIMQVCCTEVLGSERHIGQHMATSQIAGIPTRVNPVGTKTDAAAPHLGVHAKDVEQRDVVPFSAHKPPPRLRRLVPAVPAPQRTT